MNDHRLDEYIATLATVIDTHGWAVQGVGDEYAYTVGATNKGVPELLIRITSSAQLPMATIILNHVVQRLIDDTAQGRPLTGRRVYTAAAPTTGTPTATAATMDLVLTPHRGEPEPMPLARRFAPLGFTAAVVHAEG